MTKHNFNIDALNDLLTKFTAQAGASEENTAALRTLGEKIDEIIGLNESQGTAQAHGMTGQIERLSAIQAAIEAQTGKMEANRLLLVDIRDQLKKGLLVKTVLSL